MAKQQLVARIKRSSNYSHQAPPETWFAVTVVDDHLMPLRGNYNNYRFSDLALGVLVCGAVIELDTGKKVETEVADLAFAS